MAAIINIMPSNRITLPYFHLSFALTDDLSCIPLLRADQPPLQITATLTPSPRIARPLDIHLGKPTSRTLPRPTDRSYNRDQRRTRYTEKNEMSTANRGPRASRPTMSDLKLRRCLENNSRLKDDLARPMVKISEAAGRSETALVWRVSLAVGCGVVWWDGMVDNTFPRAARASASHLVSGTHQLSSLALCRFCKTTKDPLVLPPIVLFLAIFASPSSPQSHSFPPHLIALSPLESWSSLPLCLACSFLAPPRSALTLRTSMQINHCPRSFIRRHHHHVDLCLSEGDDSHGGTAFVLSARYSDLRKASRFQTPRISQGGAHSTGEHLVLPESKDFLLE
ncbi:hypothetical protein BDV98DRAFT_655142 [Pterulicium gracile]|uniref:Uncharacterized protein n=1 Tax=Pterulicium gracile TaxID=1884261 RepID=A0A5C3QLM7_9AGAR|nr:hypothetical protein BDV98DRAFT_655142 [Pterula gracilis]